jgi:SAM-dependent methyltransferase
LYDEGYYRYRESTRDFLIEARLLYAMLALRPASRILEVGCGGGALLSFLEAKGHPAVGVDILEEAVRLASRAAPSSRVIKCDAGDLPFADASFDRLVSHHLVEHLADLPGTLEEWRRVLRPGAVLAMCTPNRLYPSPRIFDDPGHVHVYDRRELVGVVEKAGFRVEGSLTVFPHLWRDRISVAVGVPLYRVFSHLPYYRERGRSLLLSARRL